jgi:twitching motility protein PilT
MQQYDSQTVQRGAIPDIADLLREMTDMGASDLHLTPESAPQVRIDGKLGPLPYVDLDPATTKALMYSVMTEEQKRLFEENMELDFSFGLQGMARFRANVFESRAGVSGALRVVPWEIPAMDELGLPRVVKDLCRKPRGLVLVTGPTGSGKTTSLAAMVDLINDERHEHIITIEDPIEFLHTHKNCIVNQRELHANTKSFPAAMRSALREDPDIVLVGEMRDRESTELALQLAETGHLTFATLHTNSAVQTINRIIDIFPADHQQQIRTQLSFVLEGVLSQSLLPAARGAGRVLSMEVLIPNSAVRNLMREDKVHQIPSIMQSGQAEHGMQTFNQSLSRLALRGKITRDSALQASSDPRELLTMMERGAKEGGPQGGRMRPAAPSRTRGRRAR